MKKAYSEIVREPSTTKMDIGQNRSKTRSFKEFLFSSDKKNRRSNDPNKSSP